MIRKLVLCFIAIFLLVQAQCWEGGSLCCSQQYPPFAFLNKIAIHGDERILDLGCGDGRVAACLAYHHPHCHILGLDISSEMIQKAQQHFQEMSYHNLAFSLGDAKAMNYDQCFDLVLSFNAFQYFNDPNVVLAGIWKSLRKEGRLAVQVPTGLPILLRQVTEELLLSPRWQQYFEKFTPKWNSVKPEYYRNLLIDNKFSIFQFQVLREDHVFASVENFVRFLKAWFPYLDPLLTQDLKDVFLDEVVELYCRRAPKDQRNYIHFAFDRLEVQADKLSP